MAPIPDRRHRRGSAAQGIGTALAAVAAIIALVIAGRQLRELTSSNRLLAASNEAMTESSIGINGQSGARRQLV